MMGGLFGQWGPHERGEGIQGCRALRNNRIEENQREVSSRQDTPAVHDRSGSLWPSVPLVALKGLLSPAGGPSGHITPRIRLCNNELLG